MHGDGHQSPPQRVLGHVIVGVKIEIDAQVAFFIDYLHVLPAPETGPRPYTIVQIHPSLRTTVNPLPTL